MQDTVDFNDIFPHAINNYIGQVRKDQLAGLGPATASATVGKLSERVYPLVNCESHTAGSRRVIVLMNIIANFCEVSGAGSVQRMRISQGTGGQ